MPNGSEPQPTVNDHDFRSVAKGIAIPYGIYDTQANRGRFSWELPTKHPPSPSPVSANGGYRKAARATRSPTTSSSWPTPAAAMARSVAPGSKRFNVNCAMAWVYASPFAHYPSGASKWNPIEHRLFSQISRNWAAEPLDSYEKALKFIRTTTTTTGLKVTAQLDTTYYPTGLKPSKAELSQLSIRQKRVLPKWNYTISPQM